VLATPPGASAGPEITRAVAGTTGGEGPVEIVLHVMSQCRFAAPAENTLVSVARSLPESTRLRLEYVGSDRYGELVSMHGSSEVVGDILELCVAQMAPYGAWLDFVECQNERWEEIPEGWEACAQVAAGIDPQDLAACVDGEQGQALLRDSFAASERAAVRGSPTFYLDGELYEGPRSELALMRNVCAAMPAPAPLACTNLPAPIDVPLIVLTDERCVGEPCQVDSVVGRHKRALAGARVERYEFSDPTGKAYFDRAGLDYLPSILIGIDAARDLDGASSIRGLEKSGEFFVERLGRFDPTIGAWVSLPTVPVTLVHDSRCTTRECESLSRFETLLRREIDETKIRYVDYSTDGEQGRELFGKLRKAHDGARRPAGLPSAIFGPELVEHRALHERLSGRLLPFDEDGFTFLIGSWDPTAEICDNGEDDDDDQLVDCSDSDCRAELPCRREKARRLDLFVMSQCPFAAGAVESMGHVLEHLGNRRSKIDFRLQFIGDVEEDGELWSMHGQAEVDEDIRQACAQHHYAGRYAFMDYVICRHEDPGS